jgi:hypothetical protein
MLSIETLNTLRNQVWKLGVAEALITVARGAEVVSSLSYRAYKILPKPKAVADSYCNLEFRMVAKDGESTGILLLVQALQSLDGPASTA